MVKKVLQQPTLKEIDKLLGQQTVVILNAVDEKLKNRQKYTDYKISAVEKRLGRMEIRINRKIDKLITSIDKFLKKTTDLDDEFTLMKADLKKVKAVLKEKLGVALD